ncbi:UPF0496 protein 1 [Apostasia shenzhenica]|uniref:UPF0496 protein 1 n=1 Tax=Apostasia shenzhenica TaxID=1088818 RepID=A0A2I0B3Y8_9ASPA|nr:UPF0496 protein 1 [Apostasia shenzhenica]
MAAPDSANEEMKKEKKKKKKNKKEKKEEEINEALNKLNECYNEACELDPRLVQFSQTLQKRTSRVAAAVDFDVDIYGSPAIHSINEAATALLAVGSTTVRTLQALREDISDDPALLTIIGVFIQDYLMVIKFIEGVRSWLVEVRSMPAALAGIANAGDLNAVLGKLREFKASVNGMTEMLNEEFRKFYNQQYQKMSQILSKKQSIEEKIKSVKVEKKVNEVIFLGIASALKICSLIPGARIITTPIDLGQLIQSTFMKWQLDNEEERQKQQKEILQEMNKLAEKRKDKMRERIGIHELDRVIDHFDKLEWRIKVGQLSERLGRLEKLQGDELTSEDWRKEFVEELKTMLTEFDKKMEAMEQNIKRGRQDAADEMEQLFKAIVKKGESEKGKSEFRWPFSVFLCGCKNF